MSNQRQAQAAPLRSAPVVLGGTLRVEDFDARQAGLSTRRAFLNVIRSRADLGFHVFINGPTVLGRDPSCTVPLQDFRVSRQHAVIRPDGEGRFILQDLGSTNGTRVDGVPVESPRLLNGGEKIFVGNTVLRFSLADEVDVDFHSEVATLVSTDPLTGLPSKRRFDLALEFAVEHCKQVRGPLALMMIDMDGVKGINDTHGHLFGAHVIGETGRIIAKIVGGSGQACRFGGDEFSLFLPDHDLESAVAVAEQIRQAVETAGMSKDGISLKPTISIGVATYPAGGSDLLTLVASADRLLYAAKEQGKNRVVSE